MHQYGFEKLDVYKLARTLTQSIYELTKVFPTDEKFGLTNQIRRASVSVCLNIAEESSRFSNKEKYGFTKFLMEALWKLSLV